MHVAGRHVFCGEALCNLGCKCPADLPCVSWGPHGLVDIHHQVHVSENHAQEVDHTSADVGQAVFS